MTKVRPAPTARTIPEWIGRTPDSVPPPHVVRRVFDAHHGRCHITGAEIDPLRDEWQVDLLATRMATDDAIEAMWRANRGSADAVAVVIAAANTLGDPDPASANATCLGG